MPVAAVARSNGKRGAKLLFRRASDDDVPLAAPRHGAVELDVQRPFELADCDDVVNIGESVKPPLDPLARASRSCTYKSTDQVFPS